MASKRKGTYTSLSAPKPIKLEDFEEAVFAPRDNPIHTAMRQRVVDTLVAGATCDVLGTKFNAARAGLTREISILTNGKITISLSHPYKDKPAEVKVEKSEKEGKSATFFRLRNSGFQRTEIVSSSYSVVSAKRLWEDFFDGHFDGDFTAHTQFLNLIGAQDAGATEELNTRMEEKVARDRSEAEKANRYAEQDGFGMF